MKGFNTNIEQDTLKNKDFRRVLYTGKHSQLVLMSLKLFDVPLQLAKRLQKARPPSLQQCLIALLLTDE